MTVGMFIPLAELGQGQPTPPIYYPPHPWPGPGHPSHPIAPGGPPPYPSHPIPPNVGGGPVYPPVGAMPPIYNPIDPGYGAPWQPPVWGGAPPPYPSQGPVPPPPGFWGGVAPPRPDQGLPGQPPGFWGGTPPNFPSTGPVPPQPPVDAKPEHPIALPPDQVWPPLTAGGDFAGGWVAIAIPGVGVKWIWLQFEPQPVK
jgi:hypothetical protein